MWCCVRNSAHLSTWLVRGPAPWTTEKLARPFAVWLRSFLEDWLVIDISNTSKKGTEKYDCILEECTKWVEIVFNTWCNIFESINHEIQYESDIWYNYEKRKLYTWYKLSSWCIWASALAEPLQWGEQDFDLELKLLTAVIDANREECQLFSVHCLHASWDERSGTLFFQTASWLELLYHII